MKNFLLLIGLLWLLSSCEKKINGRIIDNFNLPVNGVDVNITNSGFASKSNNNGEFKIDYAAGKFALNFSKKGYLPVSKTLEIIEQKNYPLGRLDMIRVPDSTGLFFKGKLDFVKIPLIMLQSSRKIKNSIFENLIQTDYTLPVKDIVTITLDTLKEIDLYSYIDVRMNIVVCDGENVVQSITGMTLSEDIKGNSIKATTTDLDNGYKKISFTPEDGKTYVGILFKKSEYHTQMYPNAYIFRIQVKK
jgi:CarboxypepD_reg-like domain